MNPLMVNRVDGKRMVIDLERVILFEEINTETCNVWLESHEHNIVHALKISLENLVKAIQGDEEEE